MRKSFITCVGWYFGGIEVVQDSFINFNQQAMDKI